MKRKNKIGKKVKLDLYIKTSKQSVRKYPNVMWFPRSKTDPQEIREVLKLAAKVRSDNPHKFFNDKLLGKHMVQIGSINVVGMQGKEYIAAYQDKSIGDVSYITNARMLIRFFRFLGLATRLAKAKYDLTALGHIYTRFNGDFPSRFDGENEEQMLLQSLGDFAFYSVNDDSSYRDASFQVRPFVWLLNILAIEPQCIYQIIVNAFASKKESVEELQRIKSILKDLRVNKTTLKDEFKRAGLNANDYSCVHNFYDSAKILVYIGISLGLIKKTSNPLYGRRIAGNARHLKQASIFYTLTDKGKKYLDEKIQKRLIYYIDIYKATGERNVLQCSFILASLNLIVGSRMVKKVNSALYRSLFGESWEGYLDVLKNALQVEIKNEDSWLELTSPLSFNFFQSIPPEFLHEEPFKDWHSKFMTEFDNNSRLIKVNKSRIEEQFTGEVVSKFILDKNNGIVYEIPSLSLEKAEEYVKYTDKDNIFGGHDRFAGRISPTNSVMIVGDKVHVDNERDSLDLLIPLRHPTDNLGRFIDDNIQLLLRNFLRKSDTWTKDQHYTWIRNCFRQFGAEAIYSGSSGMLSRADISVIDPFIGGIEAKSPIENRGSINTKAIRQALDAKVQVAHKYPQKKNLHRMAIAIGRRITPLAIEEEKKWRAEGQPVLLVSDIALYYLTLKTIDITFEQRDIIRLFTKNVGLLDKSILRQNLEEIMKNSNTPIKTRGKIYRELEDLGNIISGVSEDAIEEE